MWTRRLWICVQIVFFATVLWYFGDQVARQWREVARMSAALRVNWWLVLESALWVFASYAVLIETWRQTVLAWGERLSWRSAARIWFISNLGRYVPGKVWQIGAMSALAREQGISSVAAVGSSLLVNLVNILAGCLVVALAGSRRLAGPGFIIGLVVFSAAVMASPWAVPLLLRAVNRLTGRAIPLPRIPPLAIVLAVAGCALAWNLYGVAFRELTVAIFGEAAGRTSSYTAVFTLSYLFGYLALFAPGGLVVREGVLTKLLPLAGLATGAGAVMLVLISRLWLTVLEAAPGLILLAFRRPTSSNPTTKPNGTETDGTGVG